MAFSQRVPTENFGDVLLAHVGQWRGEYPTQRQRQALSRDTTKDIHGLLDVTLNRWFNRKTTLMMYHDAGWVPEKIPDNEVRISSILYASRLLRTERIVDPDTGVERLKANDLVNRAKAKGQTDAALLQTAWPTSMPTPAISGDDMSKFMLSIPDLANYKSSSQKDPYQVSQGKKKGIKDFKGRDLLDLLRPDIFSDVCGREPLSSLNYVRVTCHVMLLFLDIEERFKEARNPSWVQAHERPTAQMRRHKRQALVLAAMLDEDDEAMKLCAASFEKLRLGFMACIYWEGLRETESGIKERVDEDGLPSDGCSVM